MRVLVCTPEVAESKGDYRIWVVPMSRRFDPVSGGLGVVVAEELPMTSLSESPKIRERPSRWA